MSEPSIVILVVDDEPPNLKAFARVFRTVCEVRTATSGRDALELLKTEQVDLILADFSMPKMNGIELMIELRRAHPEIPRYLLTAFADHDEVVEAEALGITHGVIAKPWNKQEILALIGKHRKG